MKFCQKCGKEIMDEAVICPGCGCAISNATSAKKEVSYDDAVSKAATTNVISIILLAAGIICWLLVNMWVGAILCLAAELVALIPNTKLQKACKSNISTTDKKAFKAQCKEIATDMKKKYAGYKFSKILAIICLVCLIVTVLFI